MQRTAAPRRASTRTTKPLDENAAGAAPSAAAHARKPSGSAAPAGGIVTRGKTHALLAGGAAKPVAGVKRAAFGDVSNKTKVESSAPDGKHGKEPSKLAKTSGLTSTVSATVAGRPRTVVGKTNSSSAIHESTAAVSRQPLARPAASAVSKPVILVESETLEEDDDDDDDDATARGGMEVDANSDDAAFSTALMNRHRDDFSETDDDEFLDDPEDWTRLEAEEAEDARSMLDGVRATFEDDVDLYDTTMVAEYAEDIFAYMEELELKTMPNPRYMESQTEIEWSMRTTLVDWLLQVHLRYHMLPETLWIAVNIIDRFLSVRVVSLVKLQLVGVTAMFIAAKYEEILAPSVDEFVYMTENGYTREEILKGERIILQTLDFNVSSYCSPYSWVRRISKADDYDLQTRTLSKFLIEATLLDHRFLRAKPSLIAAIGMYLANRMLGKTWNEGFVYYSNFTESQLTQGADYIIEALATPEFDAHYVCRKFAHKKYLKASSFAREWAKIQLADA